jgi:hypothetical protein
MSRSRRTATLWLALMTALAVVGLVVPAHASEAAHWSDQRTGPRATGNVTSLACSDRHHCTAVTNVGAALTYDGQSWGKTRTADHDLVGLSSVSCPSASFCAASGARVVVVERRGHWGKVDVIASKDSAVSCLNAHWCLEVGDGGHTLRYDGKAWHRGPRAPTSLAAVSCTSTTFCMAAAYTSSGVRGFRYDGRAWRRAGRLPDAFIGGLSCGSRTLCLAADRGPETARWNGHRWVRRSFTWDTQEPQSVSCGTHFCQVITNTHAVEWHDSWGEVTDLPAGNVSVDASALSCASRGHCLAVTTDVPATTVKLAGDTWHSEAFPASPDVVRTVSCPSASFCMGISSGATARVLRGGTWAAAPMPDGWRGYGVVSCTSSTFCMAADTEGDTAAWDGSVWSAGEPLGGILYTLDCASATYCVAVEGTGSTRIWNGTTWSTGPDEPDDPMTISCPATDDCWVGGEESQVAHFDGATWSPAQKIAPTGVDGANTMTVRCATSTRCVAGDQLGNVYRYDGSGWRGPTHVGTVIDVDCGSDSSCTAVLGGLHMGRVARWSGQRWMTSRALPAGSYNWPSSLSCPTAKVCVLVDQSGNSWVRS